MQAAGLLDIVVEPIELSTRFADFEAFWHPFTLSAGPAPGYCMSLSDEARASLKRRLMKNLGTGTIELDARTRAVKSRAP